MDFFDIVHTRRSIRKYTDEPVSDEDLHKILAAAMAAPTARNTQCWRFLVLNERSILEKLQTVQPFTRMAAKAPLAILVCADTTVAFKPEGYWIEDCSAALQTMLLAARALDLGSVWCAVYPDPDYIKGITEMFHLPDNISPLGIAVIGHPAKPFTPDDRFDPAKIKYNTWD